MLLLWALQFFFTVEVSAEDTVAACEFINSTNLSGRVTLTSLDAGTLLDISLQGSAFSRGNELKMYVRQFGAEIARPSLKLRDERMVDVSDFEECIHTGAVYRPDCVQDRDNCVGSVGDLSAKHGALKPKMRIVDADVHLSGVWSVLGRSMVVMDGDTIVSCCDITLVSTPTPNIRLKTSRTYATCSFKNYLTGTITITEQLPSLSPTFLNYPIGSKVEYYVPHSLSFNPVIGIYSTQCGAISGRPYLPEDGNNIVLASHHFGVGALSNKHGTLRKVPCSFLDNSIRVSGEFSVDGKSLVVLDSNHNDTDGEVNNREVIDCCTITIAPDSLPRADPVAPHDARLGICILDHEQVSGMITIESFKTGPRTASYITVQLHVSGDYSYYIATSGVLTDKCSHAKEIFDFDDGIGPDENSIFPELAKKFQLGDLSSKHGLLNSTNVSYIDGQVHLSGPYSVLGRAIVVKISNSVNACCTIVAKPKSDINPTPIPQRKTQCEGTSCPLSIPELGYFLAILEGADSQFLTKAQQLIDSYFGVDMFKVEKTQIWETILLGTHNSSSAQWTVTITIPNSSDLPYTWEIQTILAEQIAIAYHDVSSIPQEKLRCLVTRTSSATLTGVMTLDGQTTASATTLMNPMIYSFILLFLYTVQRL